MILLAVLALALPLPSMADDRPLDDLEIHCWSKATDEDGGLLCQGLTIFGRFPGKTAYVFPNLEASDLQATLVCRELGFRYSPEYQVQNTEKAALFMHFENGEALVRESTGNFVQNLKCL